MSSTLLALLATLALATGGADARSLRAQATDCVALGATASAWDAVTSCTDVYSVFTNGDARILEDTTGSVKATSTTASVASLDECAMNCFKQKKCQWFKVSGTAATKTCTYYQHLSISARATALSASTAQFGFVLSGDPDFISQNVNTTSGSVLSLGGVSFYRTTDIATAKAISMYVGSASSKCAAVPLTLYRAFANNYQTASMLEKVASGEIFNSVDAQFTLDKFIAATKASSLVGITATTDAVDINASGDVVRTGASGSTYTFKLDKFGRVADVTTKMSYTNVLRKAGRPAANAAGTTIRAQYCNSLYQSRFNLIHQLTDATAGSLPFQAGHVVGCQFSNPQGFFNFVPQSVNSNANNGCWYNSELGTSRLLKMGCEGDYRSRMTYLSQPGVLTEISSMTGALLSASEAAAIYTTAGNSNTRVYQRPCGFFYRPVKMSFDFAITGASAGSRCSLVQSIVKDNGGKFFTTNVATAGVTISRAFAHWMYETNSFYRVRGLAVADFRANQCYTETGKLAPTMVFTNGLDRAFLKIKGNDTVANCVSVTSTTSGTLKAAACDTSGSLSRWSTPAASLSLSSGATTACIALASATSTCLSLAFQYVQASVTFTSSTGKANVSSGDNLVDGFLVADGKCVAVSSAKALSLVSMASSTSGCTVFQATYTLDSGAIEGDDE